VEEELGVASVELLLGMASAPVPEPVAVSEPPAPEWVEEELGVA
jgi:hypothetical protein